MSAQTPKVSESYPVKIHRVGGREPDGSPTYVGPWTFSAKMIRDVVEGAIEGRTLNACAGKTKLTHDGEIVRNDINPDRDADYHVDVNDALEAFVESSFGSVVFDPPFDQQQSEDHYDGMHARQLAPARKTLAQLVQPGGVFVELGWNMHSIGEASDEWHREELHIYHRGPTLQPVFLTVDRRKGRQVTLEYDETENGGNAAND